MTDHVEQNTAHDQDAIDFGPYHLALDPARMDQYLRLARAARAEACLSMLTWPAKAIGHGLHWVADHLHLHAPHRPAH